MNSNTENINYSRVAPVFMTYFVMSFCDIVGIAVDRVKLDLQVSHVLAQLIPMAVFFWFFILSVPTGIFQDKYGKKNVLSFGIVITLLGLLIPYFLYGYSMVILGFALLGIGNTIIQVSANPLLIDVIPSSKKSSGLSFSQFIKALGSIIAAPLAGWLASQFGDWKLIFIVFGVISLLSILWLNSITIIESKHTEKRVTAISSFGLLKNGMIAIMVLCIFLVVGIDVGINSVSGQFFLEKFNSEQSFAESGRSLFFLGKMIGTFLGAILLIKLPSKSFLIGSSLLGTLTLLLFSCVQTEILALVLLFIIGLGIANIFPLVFSITVDWFPQRANEISGLMIMAISGGAVLPPFMGWMSDIVGITSSSFVLVIACFSILMVSLIIRKNNNSISNYHNSKSNES